MANWSSNYTFEEEHAMGYYKDLATDLGTVGEAKEEGRYSPRAARYKYPRTTPLLAGRKPRRKSPMPTEGAAVPIPRCVTDTHYQIDSWTQTLVTYNLHIGEHGEWQCGCWQYFLHTECKHVKSLMYWLQEQAVVEAVGASYERYNAITEPQAYEVTLESLFRD